MRYGIPEYACPRRRSTRRSQRLSPANEFLRSAVGAGITQSWEGMMTEFLLRRQRAGDVRDDVDVEAFAFPITAALHHVLITEEPLLAPDQRRFAKCVAGVAAQIATERAIPRKWHAGQLVSVGSADSWQGPVAGRDSEHD